MSDDTIMVLTCGIYKGAFSGEVGFAFKTSGGLDYEGLCPIEQAHFKNILNRETPMAGSVNIKILVHRTKAKDVVIRIPDGEMVSVDSKLIKEIHNEPTEGSET